MSRTIRGFARRNPYSFFGIVFLELFFGDNIVDAVVGAFLGPHHNYRAPPSDGRMQRDATGVKGPP